MSAKKAVRVEIAIVAVLIYDETPIAQRNKLGPAVQHSHAVRAALTLHTQPKASRSGNLHFGGSGDAQHTDTGRDMNRWLLDWHAHCITQQAHGRGEHVRAVVEQ